MNDISLLHIALIYLAVIRSSFARLLPKGRKNVELIRQMKKLFIAFAMLLSMAACAQNKPSQATENETEATVQAEAADSIAPQTRQENMKEVQAYLKECGAFFQGIIRPRGQ